ncbi:hypothetical protein ACFS07_02335 [Undibacterium arcticum]
MSKRLAIAIVLNLLPLKSVIRNIMKNIRQVNNRQKLASYYVKIRAGNEIDKKNDQSAINQQGKEIKKIDAREIALSSF